jgi:hypothetical protein
MKAIQFALAILTKSLLVIAGNQIDLVFVVDGSGR